MGDLVRKQSVIDAVMKYCMAYDLRELLADIDSLPSAQLEPLTDKEQRIFLAAMGREMEVCEEVDRNYVREPYEDSLASICKAIERKVKNALWAERRTDEL